VTAPLARSLRLPRGTVAGLSAPSTTGNLARLFPVVMPAPAAPGAGRARPGPTGAGSGAASALTADTGMIGTGPGRLIVLALTFAAGVAALGTWVTIAGPARKLVTSLGRRRGHRSR
jgi:hypothetical protein